MSEGEIIDGVRRSATSSFRCERQDIGLLILDLLEQLFAVPPLYTLRCLIDARIS